VAHQPHLKAKLTGEERIMDKVQFVWWWRWPRFKWWHFPRHPSGYYEFVSHPMFYGLYLGIVEIRFWPKIEKMEEAGDGNAKR